MKEFAQELKFFRMMNNLSIEQAAHFFGVTVNSWGDWERCKKDCRMKDLIRKGINSWGEKKR